MQQALILRMFPTPRIGALLAGALVCVAMVCAGTGFGATFTATRNPEANVLGTISLTDPVALSVAPPVCTDALAPLDTDNCGDVGFVGGASKTLNLGSLSGSDVQAGSLRWLVTTTSATGYNVYLANAGAAPVLQASGGGSIADMQTSPLVPASGVDDATHFGVAMGDPAADNETAVDYTASPWVTSGGQQGELFSGIPPTGIKIAESTSSQNNDPFTATFAAASIVNQQPTPGAYAGTLRLTASII
jgi:hypothetical protein